MSVKKNVKTFYMAFLKNSQIRTPDSLSKDMQTNYGHSFSGEYNDL